MKFMWPLDDWARPYLKFQLFWGAPSLQKSVSFKINSRKEPCWTGYRVNDALREQKLAHKIKFNREAIETQNPEDINSASKYSVCGNGRRWLWVMNHVFCQIRWMARNVCITNPIIQHTLLIYWWNIQAMPYPIIFLLVTTWCQILQFTFRGLVD